MVWQTEATDPIRSPAAGGGDRSGRQVLLPAAIRHGEFRRIMAGKSPFSKEVTGCECAAPVVMVHESVRTQWEWGRRVRLGPDLPSCTTKRLLSQNAV